MSSLLVAGARPVPTAPPLEQAVGPDYRRYDGLDEIGQTGDFSVVSTALGQSYGEQPDPGRLNAPFTPGHGIPGKVGSVGASPYPVATRWGAGNTAEDTMASIRVTELTTQFRHGPGGAAPGIGQTIVLSDVVAHPPQPEDLTSIFLGG